MPKNIFKLIQIIASFSFLALVLYQVGMFSEEGREEFLVVIREAHIGLLIASVIVGFATNMSSAFKWYMLTKARQLLAGYWRIFSYYLIGQFYNLILPTSVGGDVVRAYELGKFTGKKADAMASVFVERYTGVLVLLAISGLAVLSQLSIFSVDFILFSLVLFAIILGVIAWMVIDRRFYATVNNFCTSRFALTKPIFIKLDKLMASVQIYRDHRSAIITAFVNSLVFYLFAVLNVYVTALVFDLNIDFLDMLIATPIIMLIMNIPLSIGNLGLMEFAYINVFQLMGYDPAIGLSVAILMRLKSLLDGAIGGLLHPLFVTKKHE